MTKCKCKSQVGFQCADIQTSCYQLGSVSAFRLGGGGMSPHAPKCVYCGVHPHCPGVQGGEMMDGWIEA